MGFTLKLRFTGLWVYVPKKPIHQDGNALTAVAVETRKQAKKYHHFSYLVVDDGNVGKTNWSDDARCPQGGLTAFDLEHRTLELLDYQDDELRFERTLDERKACPETYAEERDVGWLPRVESLFPGNGKVEPRVLTEPHKMKHLTTSQFIVRAGRFGTLFLSRNCDGEVIQWKTPGRGRAQDLERALPEMMELTLEVPGESVWLKDTFWANEPVVTDQAIELKPAKPGEDVVAYVKHVPKLFRFENRLFLSCETGIAGFRLAERVLKSPPGLCEPKPDNTCTPPKNNPLEFVECLEPCPEPRDRPDGYNERLNDPQCPGLLAEP